MEQSEQIDKLAAALSKAQAEVEGAKKDSANPHFRSKYADLASVWAACRDALTKNGLAIVQAPGLCEGSHMTMTTLLTHASGQWVRETMSVPLPKQDPQGLGSAVTYARRYALAAFVGVSPEDDDGNAASHPQGRPDAAPLPSNVASLPEKPKREITRLDGPYHTKTQLMAAVRTFMHEVNRAPDPDSLDALVDSERALIEQVKRDFPGWWDGSETKEPGMEAQIEARRERVIEEANDAWRANPVLAAG